MLTNVLQKLGQLAESGEISDFEIDASQFSPQEREAAGLLRQALKKHRAAVEHDLIKYRLTNEALGIAHWDMDVINGDPVNPANPFNWSREFRRMLGFSNESDFPNKLSSWSNRLHPEDKERTLHALEAHLTDATGKTPYDLEYRLLTKNGEYRNFRAVGLTLRDDSGVPLHVAGALEDITDSVHQQEMLENILNTVDSYIYVSDLETDEMLFVNRKMMGDYGLEESYKGEKCWKRLQENQRGRCPWCRKDELLKNPAKPVAWEFYSPVSRNDLYKIDRVIEWPGGRRVHMQQNMDVTDIKRAQEDLKRAEDRVKLMFDTTPLACRLWNKDLDMIECNEAAVKLFGLRDKREFQERFFELTPELQPDGRVSGEIIRNSIMKAFETGKCIYQIEFRLPDGTAMPSENSLYRVRYGEDYVVAGYTRDLREQKKMIAEIESTAAKLETALADAKEANKAKSSFLAHMSHEIRTPLNAVVGFTELALRTDKLDADMEEKLSKVHSAGITILSLVNDILDISKIESGKLELYPTQYDTPSLINDIVTLNIMRLGEKPINFNLDVDENLPVLLYGDELRLKQIFNNLLSNAFKYTHAGTVTWRISFERSDNDVWLIASVADTGVGMKPESIHKLFDDYNQVADKALRTIEGTGLGLPIAQRLAEMMDGAITVESEYGRGSTFRIRLRQGFVNDTVIGKEVARNLAVQRYTLAKSEASAKLVYLNLSYVHLLVVDDIETNLDVFKGIVKPYGVKMDSATSGPQAIGMIRRGKPRYSAVFMDHMMPGMDGIEATRIIREEIGTDYARNIPIIALTANAIVGNDKMFLDNGFHDFISKPIDTAKLDSVLRRWVRDKDLDAELIRAHGSIYKTSSPSGDEEAIKTLLANASIEGLDMDKTLKRFNGDTTAVLNVLRSYVMNIPFLINALDGYLAEENLKDYAIAVHGIKGPSYTIFAYTVGQAAEMLEKAAKEGNVSAIRRLHSVFIRNAELLLREIGNALQEIDSSKDRPIVSEPEPALLTELREACMASDLDKVDKLMERLEYLRYERGEKLIAWLREQVDDMNYDLIAGGEWPAD